jgi:membrane-associated phospholipid phosphatase
MHESRSRRLENRCLLGGATLAIFAAALLRLWDQPVIAALRARESLAHHPSLHEVIHVFRNFGKADCVALTAFVLGAMGLRRSGRDVLIATVLVVPCFVLPLKVGVARVRPDGGATTSFPSGDTATIAAAVVPVVAAIPRAAPIGAALVGLIGVSRVYLQEHYPSDVAAGLAIGLGAGWVSLRAGRALGRRALPTSRAMLGIGVTYSVVYSIAGQAFTFLGQVLDFLCLYGFTLLLLALFVRASESESVSEGGSSSTGSRAVDDE